MYNDDITSFALLVVASLCLHEWAFIHYAAGVVISTPAWSGDVASAMPNIFGGSTVDYSAFTYPTHVNRVFIQHGINLFIAGLFADLAIPAMMMGWESAIWLTFVPYLVDIGYFTAIDLPELGSVVG